MIYVCDSTRHLICFPYSVEGLHAMAADLGIKRCWFHAGKKGPPPRGGWAAWAWSPVRGQRLSHYDVPARRIGEIIPKCTVVTSRQLLKLIPGSRFYDPDARP